MPLDIFSTVDIIQVMENYIARVRPEPEIRHELDLSYEIKDLSVILNEIRPVRNNPQEKRASGYAKTTYVKSKNVWNVFWKRADNKWHTYEPNPTVSSIEDFLLLVDRDQYNCFKG